MNNACANYNYKCRGSFLRQCSCFTDHNSWTISVVCWPYWGHAATKFSKHQFRLLSNGNIYQISADLSHKTNCLCSRPHMKHVNISYTTLIIPQQCSRTTETVFLPACTAEIALLLAYKYTDFSDHSPASITENLIYLDKDSLSACETLCCCTLWNKMKN